MKFPSQMTMLKIVDDDSDERVDSPENSPVVIEPPPHQKRIAKRPRLDEEDTQRTLVETILNQAQVITLDDEIASIRLED